jgi:hypothetical protein
MTKMIDVLIEQEQMIRAKVRGRLRLQGVAWRNGEVDDVYQSLCEYALRYDLSYSSASLDRCVQRAVMENFCPDEWIDLHDIRSYRKRLGLTQQQLADAIVDRARKDAERAGEDPFEVEVKYVCTDDYISRIESGERHVNNMVLTALQSIWRDFVRDHQPVLTGDLKDCDQGGE